MLKYRIIKNNLIIVEIENYKIKIIFKKQRNYLVILVMYLFFFFEMDRWKFGI